MKKLLIFISLIVTALFINFGAFALSTPPKDAIEISSIKPTNLAKYSLYNTYNNSSSSNTYAKVKVYKTDILIHRIISSYVPTGNEEYTFRHSVTNGYTITNEYLYSESYITAISTKFSTKSVSLEASNSLSNTYSVSTSNSSSYSETNEITIRDSNTDCNFISFEQVIKVSVYSFFYYTQCKKPYSYLAIYDASKDDVAYNYSGTSYYTTIRHTSGVAKDYNGIYYDYA